VAAGRAGGGTGDADLALSPPPPPLDARPLADGEPAAAGLHKDAEPEPPVVGLARPLSLWVDMGGCAAVVKRTTREKAPIDDTNALTA
jgi:hypothetical protein